MLTGSRNIVRDVWAQTRSRWPDNGFIASWYRRRYYGGVTDVDKILAKMPNRQTTFDMATWGRCVSRILVSRDKTAQVTQYSEHPGKATLE